MIIKLLVSVAEVAVAVVSVIESSSSSVTNNAHSGFFDTVFAGFVLVGLLGDFESLSVALLASRDTSDDGLFPNNDLLGSYNVRLNGRDNFSVFMGSFSDFDFNFGLNWLFNDSSLDSGLLVEVLGEVGDSGGHSVGSVDVFSLSFKVDIGVKGDAGFDFFNSSDGDSGFNGDAGVYVFHSLNGNSGFNGNIGIEVLVTFDGDGGLDGD